MRSHFLFILILLLPCVVIGQKIKGGLALGLNATQVDGDEVYGFHKLGLNAGAFAIVPFGKHFSASLETSYSQKGSYQRPVYLDSINGEYKLILNYVEVPVLFQYADKDIVKVGAGFSWARLVDFKEWQNSTRMNWSTPYGPYKTSDTDVLIDLQLKIITGFYFNLRYSYSMGKIRTRTFHNITGTWTRKQFNNDLAFRIVYVFKDTPSARVKNKNTDKIK